jgi:hypothetical protein
MYLLSRLRPSARSPIRWRLDVSPRVKPESREALKQPDEEEGGLVVCKLLPKADSRSSVEWAEDEWVCRQIFVHPFIKEPIWVEFKS